VASKYLSNKDYKDIPKALDLLRIGCKGNDKSSCVKGYRYYADKHSGSDMMYFFGHRSCSLGDYSICSATARNYWNQNQFTNRDKIYAFASKGCSNKDALGCFILGRYNEHSAPETSKGYYKRSCYMGIKDGCKEIYRQFKQMYFPPSGKISSSYGTSQLKSVTAWKDGSNEYVKVRFEHDVPKIQVSTRREGEKYFIELTMYNATGVLIKGGNMIRTYSSNASKVKNGRLIRKVYNIGNKDGSPYDNNLRWEIEVKKNKRPSLFVYEKKEKRGEIIFRFSK